MKLVNQCKSYDHSIPLNDHKKIPSYCTIYIILFVIFLIINICISSVFLYFHLYIKKTTFLLPISDNIAVKFNPNTQTTIY